MIAWFEIPVNDMERACGFYREVLEIPVEIQDVNGLQMGWFMPAGGQGEPLGSLMKYESYVPSEKGVLIYLSSPDIEKALSKVEKAGGKVMVPKTMISENYGYMGVFMDSEGNRIALHSNS
ncbi:VOC family protein [Robertkochia sediminum]|uniref:VOC family protein n=1 Tax=Robertkochia sediminum TaxID=2785326 RepID=UPI0019348C96|nr:VOC family protein [Robertkochia sediminum]MBL7473156.1 VOC family protein [Robertkochia sediminum]